MVNNIEAIYCNFIINTIFGGISSVAHQSISVGDFGHRQPSLAHAIRIRTFKSHNTIINI